MPRHKRSPTACLEFDDGDEDCGKPGDKPGQRNAANARERARMRILSKAFSRLKTTLPWVPPDTKLSKLDTLRLATSYIAHLRTILTDDGSPPPIVHPLNLTWPFTIQQPTGDRPSRSPDSWSGNEEHQAPDGPPGTPDAMAAFLESPTCSVNPVSGESPRHFYPRNNHFSDIRHRDSDSLFTIG